MLHSIAEVQALILAGQRLLLAGSEDALAQLPAGDWIAGTSPYFMDVEGGVCSESRVFVNQVPEYATKVEIRQYNSANLHCICQDAPANGCSFLILPAHSPVHALYAERAPAFEDLFLKPIVGWVSGTHLSQIGSRQAKVVNGRTRQMLTDEAIVMHMALPADKSVDVGIVNVFEPGEGDVIRFPASSFTARDCFINGEPADFVDYCARMKPDPYVPLTADYNGCIVNVSLQGLDPLSGRMRFYAPVFEGIEYRFARPVPDYVAAFERTFSEAAGRQDLFACNCILNFQSAQLEGKHTGSLTGPISFGEIAYQLLNQTLVRLTVRDR